MRSTLGIDTASRFGSIALVVEGTAAEWEILKPGEHSSGLSGAAERLLRAHGLAIRDISGIGVSSGPGSFTGLRIGLAWAKGVCLAGSVRLALVSAHEANAFRLRRVAPRIATLLPGERGSMEAALWSGGERPSRLWGPERIPEQGLGEALRAAFRRGTELAERVGRDERATIVAAPDLKASVRALLEEEGFTLWENGEPTTGGTSGPEKPAPAAVAVAELGDRAIREGHAVDIASAAPVYGRAPNARKPTR